MLIRLTRLSGSPVLIASGAIVRIDAGHDPQGAVVHLDRGSGGYTPIAVRESIDDIQRIEDEARRG